MRFSALFVEGVGQTALSSLQHLKGYFSGASPPGFLTSLAKRYREDTGNGAYSFAILIRDKNIKLFAAVIAKVQLIILRYLKTLSVGPV